MNDFIQIDRTYVTTNTAEQAVGVVWDTLTLPGIVQNLWETFGDLSTPPQATGSDSTVNGVPAPDGGVPQTKSFVDKLGDAITDAAKPDSLHESIAESAKWIALGVVAVGAIYVMAKVL